jgi:hypothetical protein
VRDLQRRWAVSPGSDWRTDEVLLDLLAAPRPDLATIHDALDTLAGYVQERGAARSSSPGSAEQLADERDRLRALVGRTRHLER